MRINSAMIEYLADRITKRLVSSKLIEEGQAERVRSIVARVITRDAEMEREIEEEAHRVLRQHIREIEQQGISYHKMFMIIKEKLAKERGLKL